MAGRESLRMSRRHTLLVVDDEPDVVQSVQDLLRLDYKVLGATRAKDGLRILQEQEVHLVMTDQRMPEMTGVEFLSQVRGDHPEAIRLLFTGYADLKAVVDAINQGNVYRYITQPWLDWLRGSLKAGERLNRLVDQLTKMLLAGQFERPLEKRPAELAPLLKQAAEDVRPFVEQRRQELSMKLDANLGSLTIEAQKIRDCVEHLLLNAIKFTPDQGMICLSARRLPQAGVEIKVSDSGVGIEPSSLPHIFEPFFTSFDVSRH